MILQKGRDAYDARKRKYFELMLEMEDLEEKLKLKRPLESKGDDSDIPHKMVLVHED